MKVFPVIFAFLALGSGFKIATKKVQLIRLTKSNQCDPDGTTCPTGCCPEHNWFCCEDYCAPTDAECPLKEKRVSLVKLAKSKQCGPDETDCNNGWCCPEANWACCDLFCAPTAAECPFVAKQARLMNIAKNKQCGPDETSCPGGCCPEPNWFCCPDATYCAATAADCPFEAKRAKLMEMAKSSQCGPDDTTCPNGCCPVDPELNWFCCEDYCAATAADCPFEAKRTQVMKMGKSKRCGPDETFCHTACCPHPNWFCCDDVNFCAPTAADCP